MAATQSMKVLLLGGDKVNDFVKITSKYKFSVFLTCGRYHINGKSLIGIFSLDLSKPIRVEADGEESEVSDLFQELQKFAVEDPQSEPTQMKKSGRFSLFGRK